MTATITRAVKGSVLHFEKIGVKVEFIWPITDVIKFNDVLVVRVEPESGVIYNENVFGVSVTGEIIWSIEKRNHVYEDSPYTAINKKNDTVKFSNWDGEDLVVDPHTGQILSSSFSK